MQSLRFPYHSTRPKKTIANMFFWVYLKLLESSYTSLQLASGTAVTGT